MTNRPLRVALRTRAWGLTVVAASLLLFFWICVNDPYARSAHGDGYYSWIFARSMAFDGDIDFKNDYALCGDPWKLGIDRGTGKLDSPFYFGPALFWVPALEIARAVVPLPADAPAEVKGACVGPRAAFTLYLSPIVGALTLLLSYLLARRFASDGVAALATAFLGLAGPNVAYASFMVSYSHIYASFSVALLFWATARAAEEKTSLPRWAVCAVALALATMQRPPLLLFGLVPLVVALRVHRDDRRGLYGVLAILGCGALGGVVPVLAVYKYLYGSFLATPQGRYYLQPLHAHPFLVLFAPHGGLFYTAPTAWLSVLGIAPALRIRGWRAFVLAMLATSLLEIYVSSMPLDWDAAWTVGARRLTTLTPFLVVAAAIFLGRLGKWLRRGRHRALVAAGLFALLPVVFTSTGLVWGSAHDLIEPGVGHSQADAYGGGAKVMWSLIDTRLGDLAIYPAELIFAARYRLSPNRFRDATESAWYKRDFRTMEMKESSIPIGDARVDAHVSGFVRTASGLRLERGRSRLVFAAEWPFATRYELTFKSAAPARVRIGAGHWLGRTQLVDLALTAGSETVSVPLPDGEFDSGLNEILFEQDGGEEVELTALRIVDDNQYP